MRKLVFLFVLALSAPASAQQTATVTIPAQTVTVSITQDAAIAQLSKAIADLSAQLAALQAYDAKLLAALDALTARVAAIEGTAPPPPPPPPPPPAEEWTFCAIERSFCAFVGTKEVRYGANGAYFYGVHTDGVQCGNAAFGDPIFGVEKQCHYRSTTAPVLVDSEFSTELIAVAEGSALTVAWDEPDTGTPSGYKVFIGTDTGAYGPAVDVGGLLQHTFAVTDGVTYYLAAKAYSVQ